MLNLTTEEALAITQMEAPLEESLANGINSLPVIPAVPGYTSLKVSQKDLAKGALKTSIAAFISGLKSAFSYTTLSTFTNGWAAQGNPDFSQGVVRYHKSILGEVSVEGLAVSPSIAVADQAIATLPAGYRPASGLIFVCAHGNGQIATVSVAANGVIQFRGTPTPDTYLSLNFRFQAA